MFQVLDIKLKWPNDIYADSDVKIGGLIVNTLMEGTTAICNIGEIYERFYFPVHKLIKNFLSYLGLGVNLSNSLPTTCINDMVTAYNKKNSKNLPLLSYEKTLAVVFNEIENILNRVQSGDFEYLYDLYYKCWLHR
jgi:biotin---protein ligase